MLQNQKLKNLFRELDAVLFDSNESETSDIQNELARLYVRAQHRLIVCRLERSLQLAPTTGDPNADTL